MGTLPQSTPPGPGNVSAQGGAARLPRPAPLEWLYLVGGLVLLHRYFWLMDDAFVYFRYADNLLYLGLGLVFNQGEFVEGFSSPLWMLGTIAGRACGLEYETAVRVAGTVVFLTFGYGLIWLNRRLSPPDAPVVNLPLAFLAFNYGVLCYFTSGLETPLVQLLAVAYAVHLVRPGLLGIDVALGLSPLVRHELVLPLAIALLLSWRRSGRFPWRPVLVAGAAGLGYLGFRIWYCADLFPNTFYVKDRSAYGQGLLYIHDTLVPYHGYALAALGLVGALLARSRGKLLGGAARLWMLAAALPVVWYVVRIGGDARHYRYLAFPFCLVVCATGGIAESLAVAAPTRLRWAPVAGIALALVTVAAYPRQCDRHPLHPEATAVVVDGFIDAAYHRQWKEVTTFDEWRDELAPGRLRALRDAPQGFAYRGKDQLGSCVKFYRHIDSRAIQTIGFTNLLLARTRMPTGVRPAHKPGLRPLRDDLMSMYRRAPEIGPGMFRKAALAGQAPPWIVNNLETIEVLELKMFNRHRFMENLALAFTFPPKIEPDAHTPKVREDPPAGRSSESGSQGDEQR